MLHNLIEMYIQLMKHLLWWYGDFDYLHSSFPRRCFRFYLKYRWFLTILLFIATWIGLRSREFMGLNDGTLIYGPFMFEVAVMVSVNTFNRENQAILTETLNNYFFAHNETWMNKIREEYTAPLWKMIRVFLLYNKFFIGVYVVAPLVVDTVLHFGFDYLENPITVPLPLTPFYGNDPKWNLRFYFVTLANWWSVIELRSVVQAPVLNFAVMSYYFITEIRIFREQIKMLVLDGNCDIERQMKDIIKSHNNLLELNRILRAVFGLPSAFNIIFLTFAITLGLFTTVTTDDKLVLIAYGSGFFLYFTTGLVYCNVGQRLENESEQLFEVLCDLPWSRCKPDLRKNLNMIIRQAKTPLIVDYHGGLTMNNRTFMQLIKSSYSFFTLLQSMTD